MTTHDKVPDRVRSDSLWFLTLSPLFWVAHFLASYITAAIYCAKSEQASVSLDTVRLCISIYTGVALAGIVIVGITGLRRHLRQQGHRVPHDEDTPLNRHRFLGFATLLLSGMSFVATVYVAMVAFFFETCF